MANELKQVFNSPSTIVDSGTDIANGNFSAASSQVDNSTLLYPWCHLMAEFPDWAAAPTARSTVDIYMQKDDVDSTDDETDDPATTSPGGATHVGSFVLAAADSLQRRTAVVSMLGVKKCRFFFMNNSGQNMNNDAGTNFVVKAELLTVAPT
jgi:hypothetical protein